MVYFLLKNSFDIFLLVCYKHQFMTKVDNFYLIGAVLTQKRLQSL